MINLISSRQILSSLGKTLILIAKLAFLLHSLYIPANLALTAKLTLSQQNLLSHGKTYNQPGGLFAAGVKPTFSPPRRILVSPPLR